MGSIIIIVSFFDTVVRPVYGPPFALKMETSPLDRSPVNGADSVNNQETGLAPPVTPGINAGPMTAAREGS